MQNRLLLIPVIALLVVFVACAQKTVTRNLDDDTITVRVKTVFINDPLVGGERIDVETFKGVVTLAGRVKTKQHEEKAIALARTVRGVTSVQSKLTVEGQ